METPAKLKEYLKPCKTCGETKLWLFKPSIFKILSGWIVECSTCRSTSGVWDTARTAVGMWNLTPEEVTDDFVKQSIIKKYQKRFMPHMRTKQRWKSRDDKGTEKE